MVPIRKMIAVLLIALVAMLASCSAIDRGTITSKSHEEARYIPVSYCTYRGGDGVCKSYGIRYDYYPPNWRFDIRNEKETGWAYVDEGTYDKYEVGDFYNGED
ncbi:MAG: hypothetical protein RR853_09230 [Aurantimicrobium sp.]|uniref:hypothetical protein n=1 Tax=Aurantimicrobium sp. TaxID=1930784 RepID=UPI002FC8D028